MKLHLGCGRHILSGYTNIDAQNNKADLRWDRLDNLPGVEPETVEEILIVHVFEHLWPGEVDAHINYWRSILKPGGVLILEMPDLYKSAKNYIERIDAGDYSSIEQMALWPVYGDNPNKSVYDCHKWGWCFKTLAPKLLSAGFSKVVERPTQWHGQRQNRDFRVEAIK